jgi:hypothetical protein
VDSESVVVNSVPRPAHPWLSDADNVLVMSVPKQSTVLLAVTDAGRTQTINLRTGETSGVDPLLHPPLTGGTHLQDLVHISKPSGITPPGLGLPSVIRLEASLLPWLPERGWAADGRAWLTVTVSADIVADVVITLDLARCLALRTAAGQVLAFTGTLQSMFSATQVSREQRVFDVPAETRELTAAFATRGTMTANGTAATWQSYPDKQSAGRFTLVGPRS